MLKKLAIAGGAAAVLGGAAALLLHRHAAYARVGGCAEEAA